MKSRSLKTMMAIAKHGVPSFSWGTHDCVRFAANVVVDVTGRSFGSEFSYDSSFSALKLIKGFGSMEDMVTEITGESSCDAETTEDGDPIMIQRPDDKDFMLGVRFGDFVVYKTVDGVWQCHISSAICGWRISCLQQ